ncbi:hypothetical protein [Sphingomonas sp. NBWT7]|uniref:hypothetical protein n=1 Tax=Sphingomonas sp. NBWT7 TaxID=2596913 RepID=UPI00162A6DEC|nr:hypothetical protein [Sphingomonas sp. NBWT7]
MSSDHGPQNAPAAGYFVRRPRATDALGEALRRAYGDARRSPPELERYLAALDRATTH